MCLVLASILGSYPVRQGRSALVPGHDPFFYDFFHCADTQLVQRYLTAKKSRKCGSFSYGNQGVVERGTAS